MQSSPRIFADTTCPCREGGLGRPQCAAREGPATLCSLTVGSFVTSCVLCMPHAYFETRGVKS
eukprot:3232613-Pyramimonas_sp.AAC.2